MRAGNIMKIIGNSGLIRRDKKFYDLMKKFENSSAKECHRKDTNVAPSNFTLLPTCPDLSSCQSIGSWKFEMLACKINRMFAQRSLRKPKFLLYFLPIGPFPDFIHEFKLAGLSLMELLAAFLKSFFIGCELKFLAEVDISNFSVRSRYHKLSGKLQYHVSDVLMQLQKKLPKDGFAIIGLSWYDLYPCENLNFILGQGSCPHSACVASFGRFDPNFIKGFKGQEDGISPEDMKDITEIDGGVLWKLMKVLSHETCHVLGLSHCTIFECLMNESKSSSEALSQPLYICPVCMSKIQHLPVVLRTNTKSGEGTVASHLSSLHQFLTSTFEGDQNFECEKLRETRTWLYDMIQYLDA